VGKFCVTTTSFIPRIAAALVAGGIAAGIMQHASSARVAQKSFRVTALVEPEASVSLNSNTLTWTAKDTLVRVNLGTAGLRAYAEATAVRSNFSHNYRAADNGPIAVTGAIRTSAARGSGSIMLLAPGDIAGTAMRGDGDRDGVDDNDRDNGGPRSRPRDRGANMLAVNTFALTCSGSGNSGAPPKYAPPLTPLQAHAFAPCAVWGAGASTRLHFSLNLFLTLNDVRPGTYLSGGFLVVATAT
jgi:hypothetical protein